MYPYSDAPGPTCIPEPIQRFLRVTGAGVASPQVLIQDLIKDGLDPESDPHPTDAPRPIDSPPHTRCTPRQAALP